MKRATHRGVEWDRTFPITNLEIRAAGDAGDKRRITGYAAVFNRLSEPLAEWPGFILREIVAPGAFTKTLREADIRALWNHDANWILGRNKAKTLSLAEDEHGLAIEIDPPDAGWARDLMTSMERGDVDQMSFAFQVVKDRWEEEHGDGGTVTTLRTLLEVKLFDVSVVVYPAYTDTEAQVRSLLESRGLLPVTPPEPGASHSGPPEIVVVEPPATGHSLLMARCRLELAEAS